MSRRRTTSLAELADGLIVVSWRPPEYRSIATLTSPSKLLQQGNYMHFGEAHRGGTNANVNMRSLGRLFGLTQRL